MKERDKLKPNIQGKVVKRFEEGTVKQESEEKHKNIKV